MTRPVSWRITSKPPMSGISRSRKTRSGASSAIPSRASAPFFGFAHNRYVREQLQLLPQHPAGDRLVINNQRLDHADHHQLSVQQPPRKAEVKMAGGLFCITNGPVFPAGGPYLRPGSLG